MKFQKRKTPSNLQSIGLLVLFFLLSLSQLNAQTFSSEYRIASQDLSGRAVTARIEGGMAIASLQQSTLGGDNVSIAVLSPSGNIVNQNSFNLQGNTFGFETPSDIVQTVDGGYIVAGTRNTGLGSDLFLLKVDRNLAAEWGHVYSRNNGRNETGFEVIQTSDLGFALVGSAEDPALLGGYLEDVMVLRTDRFGNIMYAATYLTATAGQYGRSIVQTQDGGFMIAGSIRQSTSASDPYILKLDPQLQLEYARQHVHATGQDTGLDIVENEDGTFAMTGQEMGFASPTSMGFYLTQLDHNGVFQWSKQFADLGDQYVPTDIASNANAYYISGNHSDLNGSGSMHNFLFAVDRTGTFVRFNESYTAGVVGGFSARLSDGTFALIGDISPTGAADDHLVVERVDHNGLLGGCEISDNQSQDSLNWIPTDVTGSTNRQSTASDWTMTTQAIGGNPAALTPFTSNCFSPSCLPTGFDPDLYTVIDLTNRTFNSDMALSGKYLVTASIFVNNSILDITNCDMVFQEGTGLTPSVGSEVRATNSVFRSCNEEGTWEGIQAIADSKGSVDGCVIKNAEDGFSATATAGFSITNNEFLNCETGVSLIFGAAPGTWEFPISGNTFLLAEKHPWTGSALHGIELLGTNLSAPVTQNEFVNSGMVDAAHLYIGILSDNSAFAATENTFTNCFRGIQTLSTGGDTRIEGNDMVVQRVANAIYVAGIDVRDAGASAFTTAIVGNDISTDARHNNHDGIHLYRTSNVTVNNNNIRHFGAGIDLFECNGVTVGDNALEDNSYIGIFDQSPLAGVELLGNDIDMDGGSIGIATTINHPGYDHLSTVLSGNCVFESRFGMVFSDLTAFVPNRFLPDDITNNYLYNYSNHGINVSRLLGQIGSCSPSQPGRNSFYGSSSPASGFYDVFNAPPAVITVAGNSPGLSVSVPNVMVDNSCPSEYSMNTCGHDEGGRIALNPELLIRNLILRNHPVSHVNGEFVLEQGYMEALQTAAGLEMRAHAMALMAVLAQNDDPTELDKLHSALLGSDELAMEEKTRISYHYWQLLGEEGIAQGLLDGFAPTLPSLKDWALVERARLAMRRWRSEESESPIEASILEGLKAIAGGNAAHAAEAKALLHILEGGFMVHLPENQIEVAKSSEGESALSLDAEFLELYPNPVGETVQIRFNVMDTDGAMLQIHDLNGRLLRAESVTRFNGQLEVNVSDMAPGLYLCSLKNAAGLSLVEKLVKK